MMCACGYVKECGIWCGTGHDDGMCPPNTTENIRRVKREANRPRCGYCSEAAPYGDARNLWLDYHHSWSHRVYWNMKNKLAKPLM